MHTYLDIGMIRMGRSPLTAASLLLPVQVELWRSQDGYTATLVLECERLQLLQTLLVLGFDGKNNRDGLVYSTTWGRKRKIF